MRLFVLTCAAFVSGEKCLFMGHSFFAPIVRQIPDMIPLEFNHTQEVISRGGENGIPSFLWNAYQTRLEIQSRLDEGDVDLFGMTLDRSTGSDELDFSDFESTEYYELWINYALLKNPNTKFMIGIPWADFPNMYNTSYYITRYRDAIPRLSELLETLYAKYPGITFITNPYGLGVMELRLLWDNDALPDVSSLIGQMNDSIFRDQKGHASSITLDLLTLFFINRLYRVDLTTLNTLGYQTDLRVVAQTVLDAYDSGNLCDSSSCLLSTSASPVASPPYSPAPSLPTPSSPLDYTPDCLTIRNEYRATCCKSVSKHCANLLQYWNSHCCR